MLELILAFLCTFGHPGHTGTTHNTPGQVTTMDDTGGETGHIPPPPPPKNP
jgi:hypothetical protein